MKWMQFFTPVRSINGQEAKELAAGKGADDVIFLDVRQPREYERSHIPGSKLIPIKELDERLDELDRDKPIVVY